MSYFKSDIEEKLAHKLEILGYKLVKVGFYQGKRRKKVELTIFSPQGVGHDDCSRVTREIMEDKELDQELGEDYVLEVSSPGIGRKLTQVGEYRIFQGQSIEFALKGQDVPRFGEIGEVGEEEVKILLRDEKEEILVTPIANINYAKLI